MGTAPLDAAAAAVNRQSIRTQAPRWLWQVERLFGGAPFHLRGRARLLPAALLSGNDIRVSASAMCECLEVHSSSAEEQAALLVRGSSHQVHARDHVGHDRLSR